MTNTPSPQAVSLREPVEHPLWTVSEAARRQLVRAARWIEKEAYDASGHDDPEDEGLDEAARYLRSMFDLSDEALGIVRNAADEIVSVGVASRASPADGVVVGWIDPEWAFMRIRELSDGREGYNTEGRLGRINMIATDAIARPLAASPALAATSVGEALPGLDILEGWQDPKTPSVDRPVAWRWREIGGLWNYSEDRQPVAICEPLYDHPPAPAGGGLDREAVAALASLKEQFERIAALHPNDQPHYPGGVRPFGTGDLRYFINALSAILAALTATEAKPEGEGLDKAARDFISTSYGFNGPNDEDTPLQAAAREVGWMLSELVDLAPWERRQQIANALGRLAVTVDATPSPDADSVRIAVEALERGLKHFDATSSMCPFNKHPTPPKDKPCPTCGAEKSEGCRREITGAFGFVYEARQALATLKAGEVGK